MRLASAGAAIRASSGVDIERWRRLPITEEFWDRDPRTIEPRNGRVTIAQDADMTLSTEQVIGDVPKEHRELVTFGLARTPAGIEVYIQGKLAASAPTRRATSVGPAVSCSRT